MPPFPDSTRGPRPRFAILASGRGSNAEALMSAFGSGFIPGELVVVLSDRPAAPVLDKAAARQYPVELVPSPGRPRAQHEQDLLASLARHRAEHLLLAGYMRILSPTFLSHFPGTILNIHPSLLPDFPGLSAVAQQWKAGVRVAGATVHQVDAGVDTGPILLSGSIEVRGDEGEDGLAQRILTEVEHVIYPRAVWLLCDRLRRAAQAQQTGSEGT
jgi:phosphoribosylglycinamide formyltransferase-1